MIGKQILNYRIEKLLGEGGMGNVYLGIHNHLDRKVAIKMLHPLLAHNPEIRERFRKEASTLSQFQHPNIVALYDYVEQDNEAYLIMEFVDGKPLDEYIQSISGPIPEERAIKLFVQILDGVSYAHKKGIIHRDIKPSNFLITNEGHIKILDFGIAKIINETSHKLTKTGTKIGTILYMSPEQINGQPINFGTDIYSLGITLFQILSGKCPYDENSTEYEIYKKIVEEPLPRAKAFYVGVSEHMQAVIDKATSKNSNQRFLSCAAFKNAMLSKTPIGAVPQSIKKATINETYSYNGDTNGTQNQPPLNVEVNKKDKKNKKKLFVVIGAALITIGICSLIFIATQPSGNSNNDSTTTPSSDNSPSSDDSNTPVENNNVNSSNSSGTVTQPKNDITVKEAEKELIRNNIYSYVILNEGSYYYKEIGGISDFVFSITNNTNFYIDYVKVYIESYNPETGKSFCGETTTFSGISANSTSSGKVFSCTRGTKISCSITGIVSSELNL